MDKTQIRSAMRHQRRQLNPKQQHVAAKALCHNVTQTSSFQRSEHFAAYLPDDGEISTKYIFETAFSLHKHCYLPIIDNDDQMRFARYHPDSKLVPGRYGIMQPIHNETKTAAQMQLICLPLVAFDTKGERLGRGKGYYDRALSALSKPTPFLLGLAHAFQEVSSLPSDPWDIRLNGICTDKGSQIWGQIFDC